MSAPPPCPVDEPPYELVGVELIRVLVPMKGRWSSHAGELSERDSLLARAVISCRGEPGGASEAEGWGECAALPEPTYNGEYTAGAIAVCQAHLVPALFRARPGQLSEVQGALAPVKGNNMAKACLELAILDAGLRALGRPIAQYFAGLTERGDQSRSSVPAGVSVGLAGSVGQLLDEVEYWVEAGYRRVKLKIGPWHDVKGVAAVRRRWPELVLCADANGSYSGIPFGQAVDLLSALDVLGLAYLEQPLADDDLLGHAELARRLETPICLDEPLTSLRAVETALDAGACDVVNVKGGRLGGYIEAVRVHDLCAKRGVPVWCGGMVETGIARAANVALASLPNFSLAGDLSATGRFFEKDLTGPLPLRRDGTIAVPDGPGLGVPVDTGAVSAFSTWRLWCPANK